MKKWIMPMIVIAAALLAGCNESEKVDTELVLCQQQVQQLQAHLDQANQTIARKDEQIGGLQDEVREINQKALESIQVMMQKQSVKDTELKDKLTASQQEVKELQEKLSRMQTDEGTGGGEM